MDGVVRGFGAEQPRLQYFETRPAALRLPIMARESAAE